MNYRKIVFTAPGKVELQHDSFAEKIEQPTEVIIRTHFSLVSAGTELACLADLEDWFDIPGTPGYSAVGEIVEKGSDVENLEVGDIVYTYGPHAEMFKIDTTCRWSGLCLKIPEGLDPDIAIFARMAQIAMTSIRVSDIQLGDYVAVTGLGPIGNLAAQEAQLQGAKVIAIDINDRRIELAKQCGLNTCINPTKENLEERIAELTNGQKVSTLIEASGMSAVVESSMKLISLHGEMILLGSPRAPYQTNLTETLQYVHLWTHGDIRMKGALEFNFSTFETEFAKHSAERNTKILFDLLQNKRLIVKPFYTHKLKPEEAPQGYKGLQTQKDDYIGVVYDWTL